MAGVNKVILVGNLGKDPETRTLEGGVMVTRFPLATSETYKDKTGNKVEKTEWHNIVLWRGLAEVADKYLKKGQTVYIEGKIRTTNYQDKEGVQRYSTEIVADNMNMLGGRPGSESGASAQEHLQETNSTASSTGRSQGGSGQGSAFDEEPDELPF